MAPTPTGAPAATLSHRATAVLVPNSNPPSYLGMCAAGDYRAAEQRDTVELAEADVAEHLRTR